MSWEDEQRRREECAAEGCAVSLVIGFGLLVLGLLILAF